MSNQLQPFQARRFLGKLTLKKTQAKLASDIVELLDGDGRVSVAEVIERLFPYDELGTVNTRLRRLRTQIAQDPVAKSLGFNLEATEAKKLGPEARYLWFTATVIQPPHRGHPGAKCHSRRNATRW